MATATKKGASQLDPKSKKKLIVASSVLAIAVVWIIFWAVSQGSDKPSAPELTPEQAQVVEQEHETKLQQVEAETNKAYRGGRPPAPPSGS